MPHILVLLLVMVGCASPSSEMGPRAVPGATGPSEMHESSQDHQATRADGGVVYYRLHPNFEKVDRYCGAYDRSYVARPVELPKGERAVLKRALLALFREAWHRPRSRIRAVDLTQGHAVVDLSSMRGMGFATTSCGSVGFAGSVMRTVFQFDSILSFEMRLQGSCRRLGVLMQSERCNVYTRDDV